MLLKDGLAVLDVLKKNMPKGVYKRTKEQLARLNAISAPFKLKKVTLLDSRKVIQPDTDLQKDTILLRNLRKVIRSDTDSRKGIPVGFKKGTNLVRITTPLTAERIPGNGLGTVARPICIFPGNSSLNPANVLKG